MERKLRISQYGCGKISDYTMRQGIAGIVCAFDLSSNTIGKDIGKIAGVGRSRNK